MALSGLVIEPPRVKWVISMEAERVSAASTEYVRFPVFADSAGAIAVPTGYPVAFAFTTSTPAAPTSFTAGSWDQNVIGGYVAQVLVGPAGAITLAAGTYYAWIQLTAGTETVVRQVGQLIVD